MFKNRGGMGVVKFIHLSLELLIHLLHSRKGLCKVFHRYRESFDCFQPLSTRLSRGLLDVSWGDCVLDDDNKLWSSGWSRYGTDPTLQELLCPQCGCGWRMRPISWTHREGHLSLEVERCGRQEQLKSAKEIKLYLKYPFLTVKEEIAMR